MICKNCGTKNPETAENCSKCGAPISFIPLVPEEEPMQELISAKNLRKIIISLIIIALLALAAIITFFSMNLIGPKSALWNTEKKEAVSKTVSTTAVAAPYENESDNSSKSAITETEFKLKISEVLDISEYELIENESSVELTKSTYASRLSPNVSIGGIEISFPASYSDIIDAGWTLTDRKTTVGEYGSGSFSFQNEKGENITLRFESESGQSEDIQNCSATAISFGYFLENNPQFMISGVASIYGIRDIISSLGEPAKIEFSQSSGLAYLLFDNKVSEHLYRLRICFDLQTSSIQTADFYYYSIAN